jgi:hypothetical protein
MAAATGAARSGGAGAAGAVRIFAEETASSGGTGGISRGRFI